MGYKEDLSAAESLTEHLESRLGLRAVVRQTPVPGHPDHLLVLTPPGTFVPYGAPVEWHGMPVEYRIVWRPRIAWRPLPRNTKVRQP